jgi:hypothetical protein
MENTPRISCRILLKNKYSESLTGWNNEDISRNSPFKDVLKTRLCGVCTRPSDQKEILNMQTFKTLYSTV